MIFDLFHSVSDPIVNGKQNGAALSIAHFIEQACLAETLGAQTVWLAESHFSSETQKSTPAATIPNFFGEVGINSDSFQWISLLQSRTQRIGFGTAIHNIVGGSGGPIASADRVNTLRFIAQHFWQLERSLHIGIASGRFPYQNTAFGLVPRDANEEALWPALRARAFLEALEIFLRLILGQELSSRDLQPTVITETKAKGVALPYTARPRWEFDKLKLVPQAAQKDGFQIVLGSSDPAALELAQSLYDVDLFNLSFTPPDQIEQLHQTMQQSCARRGREWRRWRLPRTVLVFIDRDRKKAHELADFVLDAYVEAMRGTAQVPDKGVLKERALIGDAAEVLDQLSPQNPRRFHPDDRLMLWFEFNQLDGDAVQDRMRYFFEHVAGKAFVIAQTLLVSLERSGYEEISVHGEIVVCHGERRIFQTGDAIGAYPARSLLKPWQFQATGVALDLRHVPALGSLLRASDAQRAQLEQWYPVVPHGVKPDMSSPCFSKHVSIIEACEQHGWDSDRYLEADHPYHVRLMALLDRELGPRPRVTVTDGCGLQSPVLTSDEMARLFRRLPASEAGAAMMLHPDWIGGEGRVDTLLMQKNPGRVVAKEGADGLLGIGVLPNDRFSDGLGILVKLGAGYLPALAALAVKPLLEALGLVSVGETPHGQSARYHYRPLQAPPQRIADISPRIDEALAVWPGDVPYRRKTTDAGAHLALSSIETTLHLGAHTDAPNHFHGARGIDQVALANYAGACQVIEVRTPRGGLIAAADCHEIRARRVLFKTRSYPDPRVFNDDFVAFSAEAIAALGELGVVLVGIDTPSIDACHSKTLPAHHMTARYDMAILEGIVLDDVAPGLYELSALPLRLHGADASPVRAVLRGQ